MDDRIVCPSCGADLPVAARYCRVCGRALTGDAPAASGFESIALLELRLNDLQRQVEDVDQRLFDLEVGAARRAPRPAVTPPVAQPHRPVVVQQVVKPAPATPVRLPDEEPAPVAAAVEWPIVSQATVPPAATVWREHVAPKPPKPPQAPKAPRDWEQFLSGQGMAIVGGLAIVVGAVFFLSVAFSRGWIGPEARCVIGAVAAVALIGAGWRQFTRPLPIIAHALTATGMGVMMLTLFAATRLYDLIPVELGLLASLATATVAALLAIRVDSRVVAAYGIVTALAAPPILGASPNGTTIAFMTVALIGTTMVSLGRSWAWLPHLAFALSLPQLGEWLLLHASARAGLVALAGYWLLHALAAGGEEFRRPTQRLRASSALLLIANTATTVGLGATLLYDEQRGWIGPVLFGLAAAHGLLGARFLLTAGDRHPFGLLAAAGGIATLLLAIGQQWDGVTVALGWTVVGVVVAAFAGRLRNPSMAAAGLVVGAFAFAHLWTVEYPLASLGDGLTPDRPFLHSRFATALAIFGGLLFAGWVSRRRDIRAALLIAGTALVTTVLPHELTGFALYVAWCVLIVAGAAIVRLAEDAGEVEVPSRGVVPGLGWMAAAYGPFVPWLTAAVLAAGHLVRVEVPLRALTLGDWVRPDRAFTDHATASALLLIGACLIGTGLASGWVRWAGMVVAIAAAAYLMPFQVAPASVVAAWAALALLAATLPRWDRTGEPLYRIAATTLLGGGFLWTLIAIAPPERLVVDAGRMADALPLWSAATLALGALALALTAIYRQERDPRLHRFAGILAAATGVYLLSIALVDQFQQQVGGDIALDSLQKRAQVGLSVLWALLGGAAFVVGAVRDRKPIRLGALALLGLATAKVFVIDLASLNASYRVPSFIALGVLLLASSWIYQHHRARVASREEAGEGPSGPRSGIGGTPTGAHA